MKWLIIGLFYVIGQPSSVTIHGNPHDNLEICLQEIGKMTTKFGEEAKKATPPQIWNTIGTVGYLCIREDIYEVIRSESQ